MKNYNHKYKKWYVKNIHKKEGIDHHSDLKAYIEYSNDMHGVYKNTHEYNPDIENKILIVFVGLIADMINNRKLDSIVTKLCIRGRKSTISLVFIRQSYFEVTKDVKLNTTHFFIVKIPNKRERRQIALNH